MSVSSNDVDSEHSAARETNLGRRALLKGAVSAMPAVLTLQSGAAYARSSNLLGAAPAPYRDRYGRTLCLDVNSVYPADRAGHLYDLGDPARARVIALKDRDLRLYPRPDAPRVSESDACLDGRTVYYVEREDTSRSWWSWQFDGQSSDGESSDANWKAMKVPRGVFVSATAISSFTGSIIVKEM